MKKGRHLSVCGLETRPLPVSYDAYYSEREKNRFNVRGGLITPDCIDPNPMIPWDEQLEYDAEYGANLTIAKDIKVFFSVWEKIIGNVDIATVVGL